MENEFLADLFRLVEEVSGSDTYRAKMAARSLHNARRIVSEMIALGEEWKRVKEAADYHEASERAQLGREYRARQTIIHKARCSSANALAVQLGIVMKTALGDLRIDATTAGTGLDEDERKLISAITLGLEAW